MFTSSTIQYLLLLLLIPLSSSVAVVQDNCGAGCLKCVSSNCVICNFLSNYYMSGNKCVKNTSPNCIATNDTPACIACQGQRYPDSNNPLTCTDLPANLKDPLCLAFDMDKNCVQCIASYYLNNRKCIETSCSDGIKHCSYYLTKDICVRCLPGYYLNYDLKSCLPEQNQNCLIRKMNTCSQCDQDSFYSSQIPSSDYNGSVVFYNFFGYHSYIQEYCHEVANPTPHCVSYNDQEVCLFCQMGFYLTQDKKCLIAPATCPHGQMPNQDSTACIDVPQDGDPDAIDYCVEYSRNIYDTCIKCDDQHVLSQESNDCETSRDNLDVNCTEYNRIEDYCLACASGYYLSPDRIHCLKTTPHCKTWFNGSFSYQTSCYLCDLGYYFDDDECFQQSVVQDCVLMVRNVNRCLYCKLGYELSANGLTCTDKRDTNCLEYTINVGCSLCKQNYKLVSLACVQSDHCKVWNSDYTACDICSDSYAKVGSNCVSVPNCTTTIGDRCQDCDNGYYRDSQGVCQDITVDNCTENVLNVDSCKVCDSGHYLKKTADDDSQATCLAQSISHCANYALTSNKNKCTGCDSGYYLINDGSECLQISGLIPHCTAINDSLECTACDANYFIQDGLCEKKFIENCKTYTTDFSNKCEACYEKYDLSLDQDKCTLTSDLDQFCDIFDGASGCSICKTGFYPDSISHKCKPQSVNFCKTYTDNTNICIEFWDGYYDETHQIANCLVAVAGQNQCTTCKFGFILSDDKKSCTRPANCRIAATATLCATCRDGYEMTNAGGGNDSCANPSTQVTNCLTYTNNKCTLCHKDYRLVGQTCELVKNCLAQSYDNGQQCSECEDGFTPLIVETAIPIDNSVTPIPDCIDHLFSTAALAYICTKCDANKILSKDYKNCLDDCTATQNVVSDYQVVLSVQKIVFQVEKICLDVLVPSCAKGVLSLTTNTLSGCIECKPGFSLQLAQNWGDTISEEFVSIDLKTSQQKAVNKYPKMTCITTPSGNKAVPNCLIFDTGNDCLKCQDGFLGNSTQGSAFKAFDKCDPIGTPICDNTYIGANAFLYSIMNCTKCIDSSKNLFVALTSVTSPQVRKIHIAHGVFNQQQFLCEATYPTEVNLNNKTQTDAAISENRCAIYGLVNPSNGIGNGTGYTGYCLACKPGYRFTSSTLFCEFKTGTQCCEQIAGPPAASQTILNALDLNNLPSGYLPLVIPNSTNGIFLDYIATNSYPNCALLYKANSNSTPVCIDCKKGFELNDVNDCMDMSNLKATLYPSANSNYSSSNATKINSIYRYNTYSNTLQNAKYQFYYYREQTYGYHVHNKAAITDLYYVTSTTRTLNCFPNTDYFVALPHCQQNQYADPIISDEIFTRQCIKCEATYSSKAGSGCVNTSITTITGCMIYSSTAGKCEKCNYDSQLGSLGTTCNKIQKCVEYAENFCLKCITNYGVKPNGQCYNATSVTQGTITSAQVYAVNASNQVIQCLEKQLVSTNSCTQITIPANCKVHTGPNCSVCVSGYKLVGTSCSPIATLNCATVDDSDVCTACKTGWVLNSSHQCDQIPTDCGLPVLNDTKDSYTCSYCKQPSLMDNNQHCDNTTIAYCDQKYAYNKCYDCSATYFLLNDQCVLSSSEVDDCEEAVKVDTNEFRCLACLNGFQKINDLCFSSIPSNTVNNCTTKTVQLISNTPTYVCEVCDPGFVLDDSNPAQCVSITDTATSKGCSKVVPIELYCLPNCTTNLYKSSDHSCTTSKITGCEFSYISAGAAKCAYCSTNLLLQTDQCKSFTTLSNCAKHYMDAQFNTKCLLCNEGYTVYNDVCVALPTGCLFGEKKRNDALDATLQYKNFDCYVCAADFIYSSTDKVCAPLPSYPQYCNNITLTFTDKELTGTCTACIPPTQIGEEYVLNQDNHTCTKFDASTGDHCVIGKHTPDICSECDVGYLRAPAQASDLCYEEGNDSSVADWTLQGSLVMIANCKLDYFVSNRACHPYTFLNQDQCLAKDVFENQCLMCTDDFKIDNGDCVPSYIVDCLQYQTLTHCSLCKPNKYYDAGQNKCLDVPQNQLTPNCVYYNEQKVCITCKPGFWIFEQRCIDLVANHNCLKFNTATGHTNECLICAPNYQVDPFSNYQCVSDGDLRFQYVCSERCSTNTLRRYCQLNCTFDEFCDPNYVKLKNGCDQCMANYILLPDETCAENHTNDSHCLIPKIKETCLVCKKNFTLQNGTCVPSANTVNCLGSPCMVCLPGFYMNTAGVCSSDGSPTLEEMKNNFTYSLWMNLGAAGGNGGGNGGGPIVTST